MAESLETGFVLMFAGIGTVFVLLASLVYVVRGMSKLCRWLELAAGPGAPPPSAMPSSADEELIGVIGAAVRAHRRNEAARRPN